MKNHEWRDGQLIQTNKKWSHLKERQKLWIHGAIKEECTAHLTAHGKPPLKRGKQEVIDRVFDRIEERGIWIPYDEAYSNISKAVDRFNRKNLPRDE